ncbi:MAG: PH domain-containing protein [Mycobacteriales bacterium]|nr:PH domain-containing protein [Frankia sp.]
MQLEVPVVMQRGTTFRLRANQMLLVFWMLFGAIGVAIAGAARPGDASWFGVVPPALILSAAFVVLAVRAAIASVVVGDQGITVRSVFRTVRVPWNNVKSFRLGTHRVVALPVPTLETLDGRVIRVSSLAPPNRALRSAYQKHLDAVTEITELIRQHKHRLDHEPSS